LKVFENEGFLAIVKMLKILGGGLDRLEGEKRGKFFGGSGWGDKSGEDVVTSRNGREWFDGRVELEDTGLGSACYIVRDVIRFERERESVGVWTSSDTHREVTTLLAPSTN
jgi:hypothetical protein